MHVKAKFILVLENEKAKNMKKPISYIGVPLDLGASQRGANLGPSVVRIAGIQEKVFGLGLEFVDEGDLSVPIREMLAESERDKKFLKAIENVCSNLAAKVLQVLQNNRFPLVVGGDHSLAIGSISGTAQYYKKQNKKLGLIWIDAHADFNTDKTSTSSNIHGMPLAVLLGSGFKSLVDLVYQGPKLEGENIALIGIRDLDPLEKQMVKDAGIRYFTMREIDERGLANVMREAMERACEDTDGFHVSFDIDAVDPIFAPGTGTPVQGGLTYREAHLALEMLADTKKAVSADFVELNPMLDHHNKTGILCCELITSLLGKSIV